MKYEILISCLILSAKVLEDLSHFFSAVEYLSSARPCTAKLEEDLGRPGFEVSGPLLDALAFGIQGC